jgi:hypothetical protein
MTHEALVVENGLAYWLGVEKEFKLSVSHNARLRMLGNGRKPTKSAMRLKDLLETVTIDDVPSTSGCIS